VFIFSTGDQIGCESDLANEMQEVLNLDKEFLFDDEGEKVKTTRRNELLFDKKERLKPLAT
jgi:hypothetical protein